MTDTNQNNEEHQVDGERGAGITSVANESSSSQNLGKMVLVTIITVVGLGFLYLTWNSGEDAPQEEDQRRTSISPAVPFTPATTRREEDPAPVVVQPVTRDVAPEERPEETDKMLEASMRAPVIAFSADVNRDRGQQGGEGAPQDFSMGLPPGLGLGGQQQPQDRLRDKLQPTPLEGVTASVLPNLHMVVPQGTQIPCNLQTAVSSDQPGFVSCVVQRDVLSASGQVVLMEKGTSIVGEYDGGLRRGQKRIFVLWNRARTPRGVIINLASPAADGLGRSGFDGKIDTHFWERFGGAILMSVLSDATKYGFSRLRDGQDIETEETERASRDAASIALENSINIPPTLYKNQGDVVSIFVARDLDFSTVYDLKTTETRNQIYDRAVTGDMRRAPDIVTK